MNKIQELKKLNVHQLRNIARQVGVSAPTTKTAAVLINEIIAIEKGDLKPVRSKMGRPPKQNTNLPDIYNLVSEKSIAPMGYEATNVEQTGFELCADSFVAEQYFSPQDCWGVIREIGNGYYIKNYQGGIDKVYIGEKSAVDVCEGQLIVGKYNRFRNNVGVISEFSNFNFESCDSDVKNKNTVKEFLNTYEMYDYINQQQGNKLIVEIESSIFETSEMDNITIRFCTKECEDVVESHNLLLDIKKMAENLCKTNKSFTLYFVNVEYLYSILHAYFMFKGVSPDINAGQYFKELLSLISKSPNGKCVLFQNKNSLKSSYLDIIINKYCEKA